MDSVVCFVNTYPLDSDLSVRWIVLSSLRKTVASMVSEVNDENNLLNLHRSNSLFSLVLVTLGSNITGSAGPEQPPVKRTVVMDQRKAA